MGVDPVPLLTGALLLSLGVWVLWVRPREPLNRLLGFLLLLLAGSTVAFGRLRATQSPEAAADFLLFIFWYEVPAILLFTLFLDRFFLAQRRTTVRHLALGTVAVLVAALLATLAWAPELYTWPDGPRGPVELPLPLGDVYSTTTYLLQALAVLLAARTVTRPSTSRLQKQRAALVGLAFGMLIGHTGGHALVWTFTPPDLPLSRRLPELAGLVGAACVVGGLPFIARAFEGLKRAGFASALALPLVVGIVEVAPTGGLVPAGLGAFPNTRSLWLVGFALTLCVAIVRYGLAGLTEDATEHLSKVTRGVLLVFLAGATVALSLQSFGVGPKGLAMITAVGALTTGVAYTPLRRAPRALAALVTMDPEDPQVVRERVDVYRRFLERSIGEDGGVDPEDRDLLEKLRAELGLTERDHEVLVALLPLEPQDPDRPILGRYLVEEEIGEGSTARVYRARDTLIGRTAVIKRLAVPDRSSSALEEEMAVLGSLTSPHVITLYTAERVGEELVLVLEHAPGGTLEERMGEGGPLDPATAVGLAIEILEGLADVHEAGLVHGDIKPGNLLFDRKGRLKLGDFGAARTVLPEASETLRLAGAQGTPQTMAPEQLTGGPVGPPTDLHAVGAVLYRMITGEHYVELDGELLTEIRAQLLDPGLPRPHPAIPPSLRGILEDTLARDPADRPASATALRDRLSAVVSTLEDEPTARRV